MFFKFCEWEEQADEAQSRRKPSPPALGEHVHTDNRSVLDAPHSSLVLQ